MVVYYVRNKSTQKYLVGYHESITAARKAAVEELATRSAGRKSPIMEIVVVQVINGKYKRIPKWEVFQTVGSGAYRHFRCEKLDPNSMWGGPVWHLKEDGTLGKRE